MVVAVQALAPNLSILAGPVLAARIISRAGGLHNLARMPASRIQVMGAEKSLFKHLSGHAPSPKHGIIYRHPAVSGSAPQAAGQGRKGSGGQAGHSRPAGRRLGRTLARIWPHPSRPA